MILVENDDEVFHLMRSIVGSNSGMPHYCINGVVYFRIEALFL
jgi:hypothetical protein